MTWFVIHENNKPTSHLLGVCVDACTTHDMRLNGEFGKSTSSIIWINIYPIRVLTITKQLITLLQLSKLFIANPWRVASHALYKY